MSSQRRVLAGAEQTGEPGPSALKWQAPQPGCLLQTPVQHPAVVSLSTVPLLSSSEMSTSEGQMHSVV